MVLCGIISAVWKNAEYRCASLGQERFKSGFQLVFLFQVECIDLTSSLADMNQVGCARHLFELSLQFEEECCLVSLESRASSIIFIRGRKYRRLVCISKYTGRRDRSNWQWINWHRSAQQIGRPNTKSNSCRLSHWSVRRQRRDDLLEELVV